MEHSANKDDSLKRQRARTTSNGALSTDDIFQIISTNYSTVSQNMSSKSTRKERRSRSLKKSQNVQKTFKSVNRDYSGGEYSGGEYSGGVVEISDDSADEKNSLEPVIFHTREERNKFHKTHHLKYCKKCKPEPSSPRPDPPHLISRDKLEHVPDTLSSDIVYMEDFVKHNYQRFVEHAVYRQWLPATKICNSTVPCTRSNGPSPLTNQYNYEIEPGFRDRLDFSVASYNILSQKLLNDNRYLYRNIKNEYLEVGHRIPHIVAELHAYQADIVCFQEFDYQQAAMFRAVFARQGYKGLFQPKPNVRGQPKDDGCFMLYNSYKFKLVRDDSTGLYREGERLLDKPNCCQVVVLQCKDAAQTEICVANTHLLYNPNRGDIKLAQLGLILNKIQNTITSTKRCGSMPVIFCGDFNTCPNAPLYSLMQIGQLRYINMDPRAIAGQKGGRSNGCFKRGLWEGAEFHEWGLISRSCDELRRVTAHGNQPGVNEEVQVDGVETSPTRSSKSVNGKLHKKKGKKKSDKKSPNTHPSVTETSECARCNEQLVYVPGTISHSFKFSSVYTHIEEDGVTQECTTYIQNDHRTVDYIWYNNDVQAKGKCVHGHTCNRHCRAPLLKLESRRQLLTGREIEQMGKQPNHILGSDHQCLQAHFSLHIK